MKLATLALLLLPLSCSAQELSHWALNTKGWLDESGEPSSFYAGITLAKHGVLVCGVYGSGLSDGRGNTDSGPFYGRLKGNVAHIFFKNGFTNDDNSIGTALISFSRKRAKWKTTKDLAGEHYWVGDNKYERVRISAEEAVEVKASCKKGWRYLSKIDVENLSQIEGFLQLVDK